MLTLHSVYSFSSCFVSVIIERFCDLALVLIAFGVMIIFVHDVPPLAHQGALSLSVVALMLFAFMLLGGLAPAKMLQLCELFVVLLPKKLQTSIRKFISDFLEGAAVLGNINNLLRVVMLTILVWLTCFLQYYFFLYMFEVEVTVWFAVSVAVMVALAVAAPSAPGFIGVYQAGCVAAFALFGVKRELAVAFSIITHVYQFLLCIGLGVYVLARSNLKLSQLRSPQL